MKGRSYTQKIKDELEIRRREREYARDEYEGKLDRRDFWIKLGLEAIVVAAVTAAWLTSR